jgi:hypothetical protein
MGSPRWTVVNHGNRVADSEFSLLAAASSAGQTVSRLVEPQLVIYGISTIPWPMSVTMLQLLQDR